MTRYPFEIPDIAGLALTVDGPVDPATLGHTLMHEHIFFWGYRAPDEEPTDPPLTLANLAATRYGWANGENLGGVSYAELIDEVVAFRRRGGGTIVDVSSMGPRQTAELRQMAAESGLNIVLGSGWYVPRTYPKDMDARTVDDLTEAIVRDIAVGIDGTEVRSGIIGEVGAGDVVSRDAPLSENELKSVRASGRASRLTGAPVTFHVGGHGEDKFTVLGILTDEGVPPENIIFGHAGSLASDLDLARRLLARGVFIEFDFLCPPGSPWGVLFLSSDHKLLPGIATLIDEGYANQIVLGHDVCQKIQLTRYGGKGFTYITDHFLPALGRHGVDEKVLEQLMVDNPARALAFAAPAPE